MTDLNAQLSAAHSDYLRCDVPDGPEPAPCPDCGGEMEYPATDEPYCEWCDGWDDMLAALKRCGVDEQIRDEATGLAVDLYNTGQRAAAIAVMTALVESLKETK